jgi:nicotinate dehydrogenase subunit B
MEQSGTAVRFACAEARELLLGAAAARLGVAPGDLKVVDGTIGAPGGKQATYWEVTSDAMLRREATAQAKPKPPGEYKYVGQSLIRRDIAPKFTDARVVRPPSPRAELVSVDVAGVKAMPGVVAVVRDGNFLAVACEREEQAIKAREALRESTVWMRPELPTTLVDTFGRADPGLPAQDVIVNEKNSPDAPAVAKRIEARYTRPYQLHASIGPSCAVAQAVDGKLTVWTHSQGVFPLRGDMSRALGADPKTITWRARAATGRTAQTMSRSTRRSWHGRSPGSRCGCSGCARTSSCGSRSAPR